jgi:predicted RNase H-like HicB family nuclease
MKYYPAILVETDFGDWRALFPDLPNCEARGYTLEDASHAAATALKQCADQNGGALAPPRDLTEISADEDWLSRNDVQFKNVVVTMVPLAG